MSWVTNSTDKRSTLPDGKQQFLHEAPGLGVEGAKGLVHQQDAGLQGQSPRYGHPLLHAAGQLERIAGREVQEPNDVEEPAGDVGRSFLGRWRRPNSTLSSADNQG